MTRHKTYLAVPALPESRAGTEHSCAPYREEPAVPYRQAVAARPDAAAEAVRATGRRRARSNSSFQ